MKEKWYVRASKYLCLFIIVIITCFPVYWIVCCSFRPQTDFMMAEPSLWSDKWTLENYISAFRNAGFGRYIINSIIYTLGSVALTLAIASLAAHAVSHYPRFKLAKRLNDVMYITQMLPGLMMTIPLFLVFWKLNILNTYTSLILAYSCGGSLVVATIMLSGYYCEVPTELFESASIDGASAMQSFTKILLPLATPGIICVSIYVFICIWQEFSLAQNLVTDPTMYNVSVGLVTFNKEHGKDWGGLMAASTMVMLPTLVILVTLQKYFVDNLAGSVKE